MDDCALYVIGEFFCFDTAADDKGFYLKAFCFNLSNLL
jgi:hypothetical protein